MDHEVQHDAAVVDASGKRPEAVDLKEADVPRDLFEGAGETRIVAFDMPDLERALVLPRQLDQLIRLFQL